VEEGSPHERPHKPLLLLAAPDLKQILKAVSWRDENAPPVIGKIHKPGKSKPDPFHGRYEAKVGGKPWAKNARHE